MEKSTITVVGIRHYKTNTKKGDIVRFKVVKGTTTLFDIDNNPLGVLPQSDKKTKELKTIGAPIVLNRDKRNDFNFLEQCYTVVSVMEDKYIFLREMEEEDLINTIETEEEVKEEEIKEEEVKEVKEEKVEEESDNIIKELREAERELKENREMNKQLRKRRKELREKIKELKKEKEVPAVKEEKGDENMAKTELKDVNVVVECGEPQYAIGSDKIIGYGEIEVCGTCGEPLEKHHKFCSQCGAKVREEITSSQPSNDDKNDGDGTIEEKIKNFSRNDIVASMMKNRIPLEMMEMRNQDIFEAFNNAKEHYPRLVAHLCTKYNKECKESFGDMMLILRAIDDTMAKKYLKDEINDGEFDYVRVHISMPGFMYLSDLIDRTIDKVDFFTEDSLKGSEKFLLEQKKYEDDENNDKDDEDNDNIISSSNTPNIEFVSWTQQSYAWCGSDVTIKVNGKEITLERPLISGGSVWFGEDWDEHVEDGPWTIRSDALPNELKEYKEEIEEVINNSIPCGCCGGCV